MEKRRIFITGCEGYLMRQLIAKLKENPKVEEIFGIDIKEASSQEDEKFTYIQKDVTSKALWKIVAENNINTIIHAAWTFNPTKDTTLQDKVDIGGTRNVINAAAANNVENLVYLGSTTCYGPLPENPSEEPFLKEEDWAKHAEKRKNVDYRYSRNKAIVDEMFQEHLKEFPVVTKGWFWIRGAIVLGPKTNNVVSYIAKSPFTAGIFMFSISGCNPPMQFVSEFDITEILYKATMEKWVGVVNVAGSGTIEYTKMIKKLGRINIPLPAKILYPFCEKLWKWGWLKFPPSLLDLVRYPWVGDTTKLRKVYGYNPKHSSIDALEQFKKTKK